MRKSIVYILITVFTWGVLCPAFVNAGSNTQIVLPVPGTMVKLNPVYNPPILKGIKVYPNNPFKFEFVLDCGDGVNKSTVGYRHACTLQDEPKRLIKYFLAALTTPEKDRIVPDSFGQTEMGRDLLVQISASQWLDGLQDAPGFVPVIINIHPVSNLRLFLGISD